MTKFPSQIRSLAPASAASTTSRRSFSNDAGEIKSIVRGFLAEQPEGSLASLDETIVKTVVAILTSFGIYDEDRMEIVTSWIVVVFLEFFNTFEGARSIDEGFVSAARLLGASEWQITRTVVIPSTMAWVFASLSPAISFALIGVIVGEFIGAERGIGRLIIESEARAEASGMMVAVIVLMVVGVALSAVIWRLQAYLLRWQQHNMAE